MASTETDSDGPMPEPLRRRNRTAYVLRNRIYKPPNEQNDWAAFCFVGREGSGKSHTCARVLEDCDPTFDASRVFFEPLDLLELIHDLDKPERQGKAVMLDESGVGMGVRSWYDADQIKINKALQTLRDDNMILGATIPAFTQLDSQFRTRLHGLCEMRRVYEGDHAVWSWKDIVVNRTEEGQRDIKRKVFPRRDVAGRIEKLTRLKIGPPSESFVEAYEQRKAAFKQGYLETLITDDEEPEETPGPKELAQRIIDEDRIEAFTSVHGGHGSRYVDKDKIYLEFDYLTHRDAQMVKKLLAEAWVSD